MSITLGGGGELVYTPITDFDRFNITGVIRDDSFAICDEKDQLKQLKFNVTNQSPGKSITIAAGGNTTDITLTLPSVSGTIGSNSFGTIQTPLGTSPVADAPDDTLTLSSTLFDITGDSTTDTVTLNLKSLSSLGSANRILGMNNAATGFEFKTKLSVDDSTGLLSLTGDLDISGGAAFGFLDMNGFVSIDNDTDQPAFIIKHKDGAGIHQDIVQVQDQTGHTEYVKIDENGQTTAANVTMEYIFGETILQINDVSSGASMGFGTSYADPGVPSDGFKFYANPLGGNPAWVNAYSEYVQFDLAGAGANSANATTLAMPSYGASSARLQIVGEYFSQPTLNKRLGNSLTATATAGTPFNSVGALDTGGARMTGSTAFTIRGLLAPDSTYYTTGRSGSRFLVRNDSTAIGVLKHEDASATAADRMRLPGAVDMYLLPDQCAEFSYHSGASRFIYIGTTTSGTWTPTGTNVANVSATTFYECQFSLVGKVVHFSGKVSIDPTAANTLTQLRITKPVASNFGAEEDCGGVGFSDDVFGLGFRMYAVAATDDIMISYISDGTAANNDFSFTGSYEVI